MVVVFDDEICVVLASNSSDPSCSGFISNKKVMLRITEENVEENRSFNLEVYDRNDVKFLFSGNFTRHKFEEIRQTQNLKYNFDKATDRIITTIKETKKNNDVFICISLNNKSARFEFKRRDEHTDFAVLRLELEAITGSRLNNHLIKFVDKYKKDSEELVFIKREFEQLSMEKKKLSDQLLKSSADYKREISELETEKEQIEDDLRQRDIRVQELEDKVDDLESDLRQLKDLCNEMTQKLDLAVTDNEKFVDDLDGKDEIIYELQEKLHETERKLLAEEKKTNSYLTIIQSLKKKCTDYVTELTTMNNDFEKKEKTFQRKIRDILQTETNLKTELDSLKKENEALKTHEELLTSQLKEVEQKLNDKLKLEKNKADLLSRKVFNTSRK